MTLQKIQPPWPVHHSYGSKTLNASDPPPLMFLKSWKNPRIRLVKLDTCYNLNPLFENHLNLTLKRRPNLQFITSIQKLLPYGGDLVQRTQQINKCTAHTQK